MTVVSPQSDHATPTRWQPRLGIILSALVGAFLIFDAFGKVARLKEFEAGAAALGFPAGQSLIMGIVLTVCLVVYAIPRTAVLGALGITAYLGGAVTANMRIEAPLWSTTLSAVYVGVIMWAALALRRPELLKVVGLRRQGSVV